MGSIPLGSSTTVSSPPSREQEAIARALKEVLDKPTEVSRNIKNYGITDQAALIRIAEIAAAQDGGGTSKHIQNYGITDQAALIRIAEIAAAQGGGGTSKHIQNYGITDQAALIRIAEIAAAQDGYGTSLHIRNYGITDKAALIKIAEIAAAQSGAGTSLHIRNFGITDKAALIRIAEIAAARSGEGTSEYIQNYGITDQAALIRIAEIAVTQHGRGASFYIQNYGITDQAALIRIAEIAAAQDRYGGISRYIQKYGITDQAALIRIAEISAARDGGGTSEYIQNYGITDQAALIRIAEISAARDGGGTSEHIRNYGITDQAALIRIAEIAAAQFGAGASFYIQNYGITDQAALIRIAEISAAQDGAGTSEHIQKYGITDQAALIRIAEIAAAQDGGGTSWHIPNYGITDQAALIRIAEIAVTQHGRGASFYIRNYGITDQTALIRIAKIALRESLLSLEYRARYQIPSEIFDREVLVPLFTSFLDSFGDGRKGNFAPFVNLKEFLATLSVMSEQRLEHLGIDNTDWVSLDPHQRVSRIATWLKSLHPELDDSLFDYQGEVQAENLVIEALAATVCSWKKADVARYGNRGRAALAALTGYEHLPSSKFSPNQTRELWGVLVTAREVIGPNLSEEVPVSFSNLPQALETITLATALKGLGGEVPRVSDRIESNDDFMVFNGELKERIKAQLQKTLNVDSLDEGRITELLRKWGGDLTPFTVLAGRFNSRDSWRRELPVLSEIAARCLDGSFHDWRYRTDDGQLSTLSKEGLKGWRENPVKLQEHVVGEVNPERAAESLVKNVRETFEANLLVHLPQAIAEEARLVTIDDRERDRLLALEEREFAKSVSLPTAVALVRSALATGNAEEVRQAVKLVNGAKGSLLRGIDDSKQIQSDLKTLNDCGKTLGGKAGTRYYVFSTITDDPKLLLMTGDLVQSASCQNYRSGSHIETLPGYVIDGNIKLALSYVIKGEVLDRYPGATFEFDAARQVLRVSGRDEVIPLGYAVRREVLRVGKVGAEGVVFTERAYLQNHVISDSIARQQGELIEEFCYGASVRPQRRGERATFAASRNPSGVYSDAGGGIMRGEYSITES